MNRDELENIIYKKLKEIRDVMDEYTESEDAVFSARISHSVDGGRRFSFDITKGDSKTMPVDCMFAENKEENGKKTICNMTFFKEGKNE